MAERVVRVTLSARVQEYRDGMLEAARATREVGDEGERLSQTREALQTLGQTGVVAGGLLAAGVGTAIAKFADFDQAMSYVQASTHETADNMALLRQAALDAGASTVFSATESANAVEELAKAGVSTADILAGGLTGALDLAAAGGLGVADAAGIAATTMQQFSLSGKDATHVADLLAAGAGKAMGDVTDIAAALNQAGLVASQFGISVEETTGTLAAFAQAGLVGSDAGTSFRTMLLRLANPTDEVSALMKDLNINAYDQQGNFVGLARLAGNLQTSLGGMTQAQKDQTLAMIFGQDAIRASNILLREGAEGIRQWTTAVDDQGYAADTASQRLDNLKGDWEQFTGALDTAFIQMGAGANGPLRDLVQGLTGLVDVFTQAPEWVQTTTLYIGAAVAAIGLLGGGALLAIPKIVELQAAMVALTASTATSTSMLGKAVAFMSGPWGIGIGVAVAAATAWIAANAQMAAGAAELRDTLDKTSGAMTEYTRKLIAKKLQEAGAFDAVKDLGITQKQLTDAIYEGGPAYDEMNRKLRDAHAASGGWNATLGYAINTFSDLGVQVRDAKSGFKNIAAATDEAKDSTDANTESNKAAAQAYQETADQASGLNDQIQKLIDSINEANGVGQDAVSANIDYQNALAKVDETIQKAREGADGYSLTLDTSTQAGRDNMDMLVELAKNAEDAAGKQLALDGNTDNYRKTLEDSRQTLIDRAQQLGMNADQARDLADTIAQIPPETAWKVIADTATANRQVSEFLNKWNGVQIRAEMFLDSSGGNRAAAASAARYTAQAQAYLNANGNESGGFYQRGVKAWENGGFPSGIYPGGAEIHKFAEKTLPWEAYISPKPSERTRNVGIWQETGRRLGVQAAPVQAGPVYVQNPFTGEYLLARVQDVADSSAATATAGFASTFRGGRR